MASEKHGAFVSAAEAGEALDTPIGALITFKARGEQTGGALTAFESVAAPGEGPPFHRHLSQDETIYVLEGTIRVRLGEEVHQAPVGSFVFMPRGVPHAWQNVGEDSARLLVVFTPSAAGMERFFGRAAELNDETRAAEGFARFAADAGMEVLGPPLAQSHPRIGNEAAVAADPP
jgi:quercetin dioxygenase-like cupin family protein